MTELGLKFRKWRLRSKLTVAQASHTLGISIATVNRIEAGQSIGVEVARALTPTPFRAPWWRVFELGEQESDKCPTS